MNRADLILLRDEAKLGLKFRTDNRFLKLEIESLKREIKVLEAIKTNLDSINSRQRFIISKQQENINVLGVQVRRYKKPNRIVFGPGVTFGIAKGMIHPMVGVNATVNIISFLRL